MTTVMRKIKATLSSTGGDVWDVVLSATVVQLPGQRAVDDEAVAEVRLATTGMPDGDYVLEYSSPKPFREPVCVKNGMIVGR